MQRGKFYSDFIELTYPGKKSGTFCSQTVGFKGAASIPDGVLEAQLQARALHWVKRRSASL